MTPRQILERYPLFAALDGDQHNGNRLDSWIAVGSETALAAGETVVAAGTPGLWLYVVLEGRVRVLRPGLLREVSLGCYGPGEMLGDYALLPPSKNVSTCRMAAAGRLFQLSLGHARTMIAKQKGVLQNLRRWIQLNALTAYLRDENFLGFMSAPSAMELRERLQEIEFQAGDSIQADGLADDRWYFILAGEVELLDSTGVASLPARKLSAGDCFGESALLPTSRLPHAVARAATRCLWLGRADFSITSVAEGQSICPQASRDDFPWVGQEEVADCGLAALAMVGKYYGRNETVQEIRRRARLGCGGASMAELARLAGELGFRSQAVHISAAQYHLVRMPAVIHFCCGHYVVIYRYDVNGVTLGDPAAGIVRMTRDAFHQQASGAVLLLSDAAQ